MSERDSSPSTTNALWAELSAYCESDSLCEDGLREIIDRHGFAPNQPDIQSYDFFWEACCNERVTDGIIRCLLEYFPGTASATDHDGPTPLHFLCENKNVTLEIMRLLIDAFPDALRQQDNFGWMSLHSLCENEHLDDAVALEILNFLLEKCPESARHTNSDGNLPLHIACGKGAKSPEFCRILIEAYPGSERMADDNTGALPFHWACFNGKVATAEYLYKRYPDAMNTEMETDGIQFTMRWLVLIGEMTQQLLLEWCDFCWAAIPMSHYRSLLAMSRWFLIVDVHHSLPMQS
jgi:ankyrin repeat protein